MPLPFLLPFAATQVTRYLAMQGAKKVAKTAAKFAVKHANKTITGAFYVDAVNEASKGNTDPLNMMTVAGVPGAGKVLSKIPKVGKYLESAYNKTSGGFSGTGTILKARQSYSVDKDMGFATPGKVTLKPGKITGVVGTRLEGFKGMSQTQVDKLVAKQLKATGPHKAIVSGESPKGGVDTSAKRYAIANKIDFRPRPPKTNTREGYFARNKQIVDDSDQILAIQRNKSAGTQNTINQARKAGVPTRVETGSSEKSIQTYLPISVKVNKKRSRSIYEGGKRNKEFVDQNPLQAPTFKKFKKGGVAVRNEMEQGIKVHYDKEGLLASKYLNPKEGMGTTNKYLNLQQGVSRKDFKQRSLNQAYKNKEIMEKDQNILHVNVKYDKTTAEAFGEKRAIINSVRGNMAKLESKGTPLTDAYIGSDRSSRLIGEVIKRTDPKVKINMGKTNKQAIEKASQTHGPRGSKGVIQTDIPKKFKGNLVEGIYTAETYAKASQTDAALKWIRAGKFKGGQHVSIGNRQVSALDTYTAQVKQANTGITKPPSNTAAKEVTTKAQKAKEALELRNQEALKRKNMLGTGLSSKELADKFSKEKFDTITRNEKGTIISIISKPQEVGNLVTKEGVTKSVSDHVRGYLRSKFKTPKSQKKNIAKRIIVGKLKKYDNVSAMIVLNKKSTTAKDMANLKQLGQDEFRLLMGSTRKWSKQAFRKFVTGVRNQKSTVGNIKLFPDSLK
jgi:hypothetical protein